VKGLDPKRLLDKLRTLLSGFTSGQKAITGVAVLAVVVGSVLFLSWASKPTYSPLFTNLSSTDAAAITAKLNESKEPYQLADGGTTIMVPQADVYQQRIDLSGAGLPAGGAEGYSLLDKQSLTTSEFQQHVTYQRALEGELSKTIDAIDGVSASVVHLAVPEKDVFADSASKPSASVLVKTRPGVNLRPEQVQAMLHLVSSSVPGLDPADVAIADGTGQVLNAPGQTSGVMADTQSEQTQSFEKDTSATVQTMLDKVVGPGHAVVRVDANLNYDETTTDTQRYLTDKNVAPLTQTSTKETYTGSGVPVGGVLGPDNNAVPTGTAGPGSSYDKTSNTQQNSVGTQKQTVKSAPGQVRRMSIAVVLDQSVGVAGNTANISKLVAAAAGVVPSRGDTVQVSAMPFDTSAAAAAQAELDAAAKAKAKAAQMNLAKTAAILLLVVVALLWLWRRSRKVERTPIYLPAVPSEAELAALAIADQALSLSQTPQKEIEGPDEGQLHRLAVRGEIGELIEKQPDEVAQLLRGWLADRRS
jgi:flagellar M-ring protein FliF